MSISKSEIVAPDGIGVFTRDYEDQLEEAAERESDTLTTFRSQKPWRSVENAMMWRDDNVIVYSCLIGKEQIYYTAVLEDILLHPTDERDGVDKYLESQLDIHRHHDEGLWEGDVSTLYQVSQVTRLDEPFPFTELRKVSNGEPLDADYGYSYSVVQQPE